MMVANDKHIVPRLQEPNSEKIRIAGLARKMTFGTTKNKMPDIEDCNDIKNRPSIMPR